jgi:D-sedoheptulose 7-phosphate isomerase
VSDFLYPFLKNEAADVDVLLDDLATSARAKAADSSKLQSDTVDRERTRLEAVAVAMAEHFDQGARLFTFGNGGSSTDATSIAALFSSPPRGTPLPAHALVADSAVLTALGNDVGFDLVFSRQLIAYGAEGDIAVGLSTSGNSRNLLAAFGEARSRRMLTIGLAGYDGGDMGRSDDVQHCLIVASESVHRIQEAQGALAFALWSAVQDRLAAVGAERG